MGYNNFIVLVLLVVTLMGISIHVQNKYILKIYVYNNRKETKILVNKHTTNEGLNSEFLRKLGII